MRKQNAQAGQANDSVAPAPAKPAAAKSSEPPEERIVEKSKKDVAAEADKKQAKARPANRPPPAMVMNKPVRQGRIVAGKTFRQENGVWIDDDFSSSSSLPVVRLTRDSEAYQQTLKDNPGLKPYFDLKPVLVVWQGKVYRVENK